MRIFQFLKLHRLSISNWSAIITMIALLLTFGVAFTPIHGTAQLESKFTKSHVLFFHMYDSSNQRYGIKLGLAALFFMLAVVFLLNKYDQPRKDLALGGSRVVKWMQNCIPGFLILGGALYNASKHGDPRIRNIYLFISLLLAVVAVKASRSLPQQYMPAALWAAIVCYIALLTIPGFYTTPYLLAHEFSFVQLHFSWIFIIADKLAMKQFSADWGFPDYGFLPTALTGALEAFGGLLDFGQHINIIRLSQALFLFLSCLALYLWKPKRPGYVLIALLLFGTYASTSHAAVIIPNQSGYRFLGFPIGIIFLLLIKNQPIRVLSFMLGLGSGFLLLFNLETGIALSSGYVVFLLTRIAGIRVRSVLFSAAIFFAGMIILIVTAGVLFWWVFGFWPFSIKTLSSLALLNNFAGGYGGMRLKFYLLPILIFGHCVYLVCSILLTRFSREISTTASIKLFVSVTILIWFAYYMNRAVPWNLWSYLFLYSFLFASYVDIRLLRLLWSRSKIYFILDSRVAALLFILLPNLLSINYDFEKQTLSSRRDSKNIELSTISGVKLRSYLIPLYEGKATFLKNIAEKEKCVYLTRDSILIPLLTKQYNPWDYEDIFFSSIRPTTLDQIVRTIKSTNPDKILVDDPAGILVSTDRAWEPRALFFAKIMEELGDQYRVVDTRSDWKIWERKGP